MVNNKTKKEESVFMKGTNLDHSTSNPMIRQIRHRIAPNQISKGQSNKENYQQILPKVNTKR
jgi:hypothetical protein